MTAPGTRLGTAPFGDIAVASGTRLARLLPPVMRFEAWSRAPVSYDCPGSRTCRYRRRDASRDCSLRRYILCLGDASRDCSLRRCASMRVLETERRAAARAREHAAMAAGTRRGTAPSGDISIASGTRLATALSGDISIAPGTRLATAPSGDMPAGILPKLSVLRRLLRGYALLPRRDAAVDCSLRRP